MVWRWTQYSFTKGRNNLSFPLLCFPQPHFLPRQLNNSKSRVLKATSLSIPFPTQLRGLLRSPPETRSGSRKPPKACSGGNVLLKEQKGDVCCCYQSSWIHTRFYPLQAMPEDSDLREKDRALFVLPWKTRTSSCRNTETNTAMPN